MAKNCWVFAAAWLALGAPALPLPAAPATVLRAGARYTIDKWETEDGLPQSAVIALAQTRDGYLWLGTPNSLVRFDGIRFSEFDESNTPGLNSSPIVCLFEDRQGNLWIGTQTAGVAVLKDGQVTTVPGIGQGGADRRLAAACEDTNGVVWLYTASGELWRYWNGRVTSSFVLTPHVLNRYRALIAEPSGPVWVGTDSRQCALGAVAAEGWLQELPVAQELPETNQLDFLLAGRRSGYWRLAGGHIQKWTGARLEQDWSPYPWGEARIGAACEDRAGNLVVGTLGAGLFWFDAQGNATCLSTNDGLSHNWILSLLVDREGNLWAGTDGGGLNRIKRRVFEAVEGTGGWVVQSVAEDSQGRLWIGARGGEVGAWQNGALQRFRTLPNWKEDPSVGSVFADHNQQVWVGTRAGLFQFKEDRFQQVGLGAVIQAIHQDRAGRLWLGTQEGLVSWNPPAWNRLSQESVTAIADDAEGNLWVGTEGGGLSCLRDGKFTVFRKQDSGLPSDNISSLWADAEGVLWIGTHNGLARFHRGQWTRYTTREGLLSNRLGYLIEDDHGYLWIGSTAGLMRVPKKALNDFARDPATFIPCRVFGKPDGLPAGECTLGSQPGAGRTRDGRLWFPTIKGLVSVDPAALTPNTNPPPVVIESVWIDGQPQAPNALRSSWPRAVIIPAGKERLEIQYTSLNLAAPERARFKYRLENHETVWIDAGNTRIARYTKLPPGEFRFQVTACNEDGVWNPAGSTLALIVQPPFWRTWWFITSAAAVLLGTIVAIVYYLSTQKLARQVERLRQQEALEKERSRIARDLHDQLGASLTQVALLGELVESDKELPDEVEAHAQQISHTARDTTRVLDEIVWAVNPSNDTLEGLINYVCKYAQEYLAVAGLRYRLDVPAQLPATSLPPDTRHNVFLAAKEAITNVVRHAKATAASLRLRVEPAAFTLEIQDDGRGLADPEKAGTRNGLRNMRKRMEDIGGQFAIAPAPGGGTVVRLTVPLEGKPQD